MGLWIDICRGATNIKNELRLSVREMRFAHELFYKHDLRCGA